MPAPKISFTASGTPFLTLSFNTIRATNVRLVKSSVSLIATATTRSPRSVASLNCFLTPIRADARLCPSESNIYFEDGYYYDGHSFTTAQSGTYTFYAKYNNLKSNNVTITANEVETPPAEELNIGDLYSKDGVVGVVFRVPAEDTPGLIISLDEGYCEWSTEYAWVNCGFTKGELNCEMIYRQENWEEKYPAAKWCYDHGDGWFLPSDTELAEFWIAFNGSLTGDNKEQQDLFNSKFTTKIEIGSAYWSSNEISEDMATAYQLIDPNNIVICLTSYKYQQYPVRAVKYIY